MKERGGEKEVNHTLLKETILKNVAYLDSKSYLQEKEVYDLVKTFFKEYLGLNYEFTHEELEIELQNIFYDKKLEDEVLSFLRETAKIEYSDDELLAEDLKKLLKQFSKIVEMLIKAKKKEQSFISKILFWKESKTNEVPVEREEQEEIVEAIEDLETEIKTDTKPDLFSPTPRVIEHKEFNEQEVHEVPVKNFSAIEALKKDLNQITKNSIEKSMPQKTDSKVADKKELSPKKTVVDKTVINPADKQLGKSISKQSDNSSSKQMSNSVSKLGNKSGNEDKQSIVNKKIEETLEVPKPDLGKEDSKTPDIQKLLNKFNFEKDKKKAYIEIRKVYDALSNAEKEKHYSKVNDLYEKIK